MDHSTSSNALQKLRVGQLRLLVEMDRSGSLRRSAAGLHLTQSALSRALKELESTIGVRLFDRDPGGLKPTPAGVAAIRGAKLLLTELGVLVDDIHRIARGEFKSAKLGITSYLGYSVLPAVLQEMSESIDLGRFLYVEDWTTALIKRLMDGELDMLLVLCTPESTLLLGEGAFDTLYLFQEKLVAVAHPGHPLAAREHIEIRELVSQPWVLPYTDSLTRQAVESAMVLANMTPPPPAIEADTLVNVIESVVAGLGISACPLSGVQAQIEAGRLVKLNIEPEIPFYPVVLIRRRMQTFDSRLSALADALQRLFAPSR